MNKAIKYGNDEWNNDWYANEAYGNLHTLDTDLPDRIYNADELNEPAYQQRYIYGGEWHEPFLAKFCESYEMFQFEVDVDFETRQFVTLKQPTKTTI